MMNSVTMYFTTIFLLYSMTCFVSSTPYQDRQLLETRLFSNYSPLFPPMNTSSGPVDIRVLVSISKIEELDESDEVLVTCFDLFMYWTDERLTWDENSTELEDPLRRMTLPSDQFWTPRLHVVDSFDREEERHEARQEDYVEVYSSGLIYWHQRLRSKTPCPMEVYRFPKDSQKCLIKLTIKNALATEATFTEVGTVNTYDYKNGEWTFKRVVSSTCVAEDVFTYTYRSCFELTLNLERKSMYHTVYLVWPIFLLVVLSPLALMVQSTSGEKVSVSVTLFLSFIIIMSQLSSIIPNCSSGLPSLTWFLYFQFTLSSVVVALSIGIPYWKERPQTSDHVKLKLDDIEHKCFVAVYGFSALFFLYFVYLQI